MKVKIIILCVILMFFIKNLNAQFFVPFITIDTDGWTNIREKPNALSKIVGKVHRYQIFYFIVECDDDYGNYSSNNWLLIHTGQVSGYIYKKKICNIEELPSLKTIKTIRHIGKGGGIIYDDEGTIICANDTLTVTMQVQPFDKTKHKLRVENTHDGEHVWSIDDQRFYGTENRMPDREIKSLEILHNEKKTLINLCSINNLYDPHTMKVFLGQHGELYLFISGGGDAGWYGVWLSVVDGDILDKCFEDNCW